MSTTPSPEITKRRVTMTTVALNAAGDLITHQAVDYVRPDILDAYVADARTNWQHVEVFDEPDAGPAGYHGPTFIPEHLDHPLAGHYFPATPGSDVEAALLESEDSVAVRAVELGQDHTHISMLLEGNR